MPEPIEITDLPAEVEREAPPKRASRTRKVVLGSVAAVAAVGVGTSAILGWRVLSQRDTTLAAPPALTGLARDTSTEATSTAEYLGAALAAGSGLDDTVSAIYGDRTVAGQTVIFFGGKALILTPASELERAFALLDDETGSMPELRDVEPGALGGAAKCGVTAGPDSMAICGWADHGALAMVMLPGRTLDQGAEILPRIRGEVQSR